MTPTLLIFALNMGAILGESPQLQPAAIAYVDVQAIFTPASLVATRKVIGGGRTAGVWSVAFCQDTAKRVPLDTVRALALAPNVLAIPNALAEDAIGRQAASDPKSIIGSVGDSILGLAGDGTLTAGLATGSRAQMIIGGGLKLAQIGLQLAKKRAPDATPYFTALMPDVVEVPAAGCTTRYYLFASLVHDAHMTVVTVKVPLLP